MITDLNHALHYQDLNQLFESCLKLAQDTTELDLESIAFRKVKEKIESETNTLISTFSYDNPEISFIKLVYHIHEIIENRNKLIAISCISEYEIHILEVLFKGSNKQLDSALNEWYNDLLQLYENSITFDSHYLLALIFNSLEDYDRYITKQGISPNSSVLMKHFARLKQFSKITKSDFILRLCIGTTKSKAGFDKLLPFGISADVSWFCEKNHQDYYKGSLLEDWHQEHYLHIPASRPGNIQFIKFSLLYLINEKFLIMNINEIDSFIQGTFLEKKSIAKTSFEWSPNFKKGNLIELFREWLKVMQINNKYGFCRAIATNMNTPYSARGLYEFLKEENKMPVHDYEKQIYMNEIYVKSGVLEK